MEVPKDPGDGCIGLVLLLLLHLLQRLAPLCDLGSGAAGYRTGTTSPHHPTWDGRTKKGLSVHSSKAPKLRQNPTPKPVMCPPLVFGSGKPTSLCRAFQVYTAEA